MASRGAGEPLEQVPGAGAHDAVDRVRRRHVDNGHALVGPHVVLDHHETGGVLTGVLFRDIRPHLGATSTMVTGYLLEQKTSLMIPAKFCPIKR